MRCSLISIVLLMCVSTELHAADWSEFRGPTGQGHANAKNPPTTWSESENITWKVRLPGSGWSSPVAGNGRIYLTTAVGEASGGESRSLRVICLNAQSGAKVWDREAFRQTDLSKVEIHPKNSHASPTPVLEGNRLYVHFGPHGTACLSTEGKVLWKNKRLTYSPEHGNGGSPAVAGELLIICCDGNDQQFVVGLNKRTGQQVWRTERDLNPSRGFSFSTPTLLKTGGRSQVICPGSGGVWSYDPRTGKSLWRVAYGEGYSVVPRPVVGHGIVYVCSGFDDEQLFAIDPTGSGDVTGTHVKWRTRKGVPKTSSVLLFGKEIYLVDDRGVASCLDALTGEQHWRKRLGGSFSASPTLAGGLIYFQNETGGTTIIEPGKTYKEIATNEIGDGQSRTFASFALVGNAILLRSETHLYRIEKLKGSRTANR